ncbi:MAG: M20 family metallopeptidase [Bacillota bacterium]|nr:M20 family metallopeptidase [Bacillota bacterium]
MNLDQIKKQILEKENDFIAIRRQLHQYPELGMKEYKTSNFVYQTLKSFGLKNIKRTGHTGLVAVIGNDYDNCVAIRADMDGLAIEEDNDSAYKSKIPGLMHACGHDLHTTALLAAAYIFHKNQKDLKGCVKLIFQPGEEVAKGAKYMIDQGVLRDQPVPKCIFGLHSYPYISAGKVYHRHGKMGASSDRFIIKVLGKSGHAAHPEKAVDPILIASHIVLGLQEIVSREISATDQAVITVASIQAGQTSNLIPESALIKGSIRCLDEDIRAFVHQRIDQVAKALAQGFRGQAQVQINKGIPVSYNDPVLSKKIEAALIKALGKDKYIYNPEPTMGSEDFAYYGAYLPSAMYRLGTGFEDRENYPLHSKDFSLNDQAVKTGILSMVAVALELLQTYKGEE